MIVAEPMASNRSHTWLVTGGAGFLGVHLCRGLIERGEQLISFDRADFPVEEKVEGVAVVQGDIRDAERLARSLWRLSRGFRRLMGIFR